MKYIFQGKINGKNYWHVPCSIIEGDVCRSKVEKMGGCENCFVKKNKGLSSLSTSDQKTVDNFLILFTEEFCG